MTEDMLDQFGSLLIEWVRDWSIEELDRIVNGDAKPPIQGLPSSYFKNLPPGSREALEKLVPVAVDTTLHYFLWLIEDNRNLDLVMKTSGGFQSLKNESDGLSGELFSSNGWIARFSRQRKNSPHS